MLDPVLFVVNGVYEIESAAGVRGPVGRLPCAPQGKLLCGNTYLPVDYPAGSTSSRPGPFSGERKSRLLQAFE